MNTEVYQKLNTTGSHYRDVRDNTYYSYNTPIYKEFITRKGTLKVFNNTFYSMTTAKHQSITRRVIGKIDLELSHCPYGYWELDTGLRNEIRIIEYELKELNNKTRKLGKRQAEQKEYLLKRLQELQQLYAEVK